MCHHWCSNGACGRTGWEKLGERKRIESRRERTARLRRCEQTRRCNSPRRIVWVCLAPKVIERMMVLLESQPLWDPAYSQGYQWEGLGQGMLDSTALNNDPGERCTVWEFCSTAFSLAGWGKWVWRVKNGCISQVIPKTVLEDRPGLKCQMQSPDLDDLPLVPCKRNPDTPERIADGSSAPFLPICSSPFFFF